MSFRGHYQNAYVTHDLERAMELTRYWPGLGDFRVFDASMLLKTPSGEKASSVRVALAWAGGLQIELIQPVSGYLDPYRSALPDDPKDAVPRFHHIAVRRDDLAEMRREVDSLGLDWAFESGGPGLTCLFLDARQRLGHYFEFVFATSAGWEMLGWPEGLTVRC
jgi:hypothetical protein